MPSIDLAGVKTQLTTSLNSINSLYGTFQKLGSGISELGSLGDAVPALARSLTRSVASIGTSITGASAAALPKMQSAVENLIPNTGNVQDLCSSAMKKIDGGMIPAVPGLKENIGQISDESTKVETTSKSVSTQMDSENKQADPSYQLLIGEMDGLSTILSNYTNGVGTYLFNPSGGTMPHFSQVVGDIKLDQLLTTANNIKNSAVDLSSGAVTSTLYKAAGIIRETSLRGATKTSLYQNAELEFGKLSEETTNESSKNINRTRNTTPEQNTGI